MNNTFIIVCGGSISKDNAIEVIRSTNGCIIGVDRGMDFLYQNQILPNYALGDFDSVSKEAATYYFECDEVSVKELNKEKDESDTEVALSLAVTMGAKEIIVLGATGGRLDHFWANVQSLMIPLKRDVKAFIIDDQNRISLHDEDFALERTNAFGDYFSFFALGEDVHGLTIEGAKYPLRNHSLSPVDSLSVSNEYLEDKVSISFNNGVLILMETRDLK